MNKNALTYDDIQLVPRYSEIKSRNKISLKTLVSKRYGLLIPLVASPMDTVCDGKMAYKMAKMGGVGCIHRFMPVDEQANEVKELCDKISNEPLYGEWGIMYDDWHSEIHQIPIMAAIGVKDEDKERAKELVRNGANVLLIDVAHGHHSNVIEMIKWCKTNLAEHVDIIAGNIATAYAAKDLQEAGADGLRVGIGGGCFTPNMKVKTTQGVKRIEDIEIGDIVYTHTEEEHEVVNKFIFDRDEEIMVINGIECTKNHEFYVVNKKYLLNIKDDSEIEKYAEWISAENLTTDYLLIEL